MNVRLLDRATRRITTSIKSAVIDLNIPFRIKFNEDVRNIISTGIYEFFSLVHAQFCDAIIGIRV